MRRLPLAALMCVLITAAPTFAADRSGLTVASVVDPNTVEFTPSPDHNTTGPDGQWLVNRYNLEFYGVGETQPFRRVDLGRPIPSADGKIHLTFDATWGVVGETYEARVSVYSATESATSALSNAFMVSGPCQYALSATTSSFGVAGGAGTVNVVTADKCTWTLTSPASWLTVQTPSSNGAGAASFVVAANASASPRSVSVTLGGQTLTIVQAGSCTKTLDAAAASLPAAGGSGTVGVSAPSGCSWGSAGAAAWLQVTNGSGAGSGSLGYSAAANPSAQVRSTTLTIAGLAFTVTQAATSPACAPMVSPSNLSIPAMGASGNLAVTAPTECDWTATSSAGWIRLFASGIPKKGIGYRVEVNASPRARTATLTIAGQTITVTQGSATVSNTMSPAPSGGDAAIAAGKVERSEVGQTSGASRTATLTNAGQTILVPQSVATVRNTMSPVSSGGSTAIAAGKVERSDVGQITEASRAATLTNTGQPQSAATVRNTMSPVSSGANTAIAMGKVELGGASKTFEASGTATPAVLVPAAVPMATAPCVYTVRDGGTAWATSGGSAAITVTTAPGCQWKVATTASWIKVSSALVSGSGQAAYSLSVNNTAQRRTGTIVVAGRIITVEQNAADVPRVAVADQSDLQTLLSPTVGGGTVSGPTR